MHVHYQFVTAPVHLLILALEYGGISCSFSYENVFRVTLMVKRIWQASVNHFELLKFIFNIYNAASLGCMMKPNGR